MEILVMNPGSSQSVTDTLEETLTAPPGVSLTLFTGPAWSPPSIDNTTTSILSAAACFYDISFMHGFDAFLVCCFSDHPLVHMLREHTTKPVLGIFEAAISHAMLCGTQFGIVTSGAAWKIPLEDGVRSFAGTQRFVGVEATGIGVLEFQGGNQDVVRVKIKNSVRKLVSRGADVVILGCAGMTGMKSIINEGAREAGKKGVVVIDGPQAGVEILTGLLRIHYR